MKIQDLDRSTNWEQSYFQPLLNSLKRVIQNLPDADLSILLQQADLLQQRFKAQADQNDFKIAKTWFDRVKELSQRNDSVSKMMVLVDTVT